MPRNGSGTFAYATGYPFTTGTVISSTDVNAVLLDIANTLTASIAKDGQTTATANIPMGGFKFTSIGDATTRTQFPSTGQIQDGDLLEIGSVAGTNTITGSLTPSIGSTGYATGQKFLLIPANTNTGATTIALNSLAAKNIYWNGAALVGGELHIGVPAIIVYDGTQFNLIGAYTTATKAGLDGASSLFTTDAAAAGMLADIAALTDPNADRILGWDDSAGAAIGFALSTGLTTSGTNLLIDTAVVPQLAAANTFTADQMVNKASAALIARSSTASAAFVRFDINGANTKGYVGSAGATNDLATGSAANDLVIRAASANIIFSADDGTTKHAVLSSGGLISSPNANASEIGYKGLPAAGTSSGALALADTGKCVLMSGNVTIPTDASVAFPVGTLITLVNNTTGTLTVAAVTPGTTTLRWSGTGGTDGTRTVAAYQGLATIVKTGANFWVISGDLS